MIERYVLELVQRTAVIATTVNGELENSQGAEWLLYVPEQQLALPPPF